MIVNVFNHEGFEFIESLFVKKDLLGVGWFIYGRNSVKYGKKENGDGNYVKVIAYPAEKRTRNGRLIGFKTKRAALEAMGELKNNA